MAAAREDAFYSELGARLQTLRTDRGLTQQQMADTLELTRSSVANLEAGRQRIPLHLLLVAASTLQVAVQELLPTFPHTLRTPDELLSDVPADHRDLVNRIVAAAPEGEAHVATQAEHSRAQGRGTA